MAEPCKLVNGNLVVNVMDADGVVLSSHDVDVLALKITCEECVEHHNLPTREDGTYKVSSAFILDLAGRLQIFLPNCNASMAYQLWLAADGAIDHLKKNTPEPPSSPTGSEPSPAP